MTALKVLSSVSGEPGLAPAGYSPRCVPSCSSKAALWPDPIFPLVSSQVPLLLSFRCYT